MSIPLQNEVRLDNKCIIIKKQETITIECSNPACKNPLLIVHQTPDENKRIEYNLRVQCPFCTRRSYDFEVTGDLKYIPVNGVLLVGIEEKEKENVVIIKTQKAK